MLTKGQGHKVKGQGEIYNFVFLFVLAINQEWMIGYWRYLQT